MSNFHEISVEILLMDLTNFYSTYYHRVCNAVGYFNYRYFYNMLLYNTLAMSYGLYLCFSLYMNLESDVYYEQVKVSKDRGLDYVQHLYPGVPTPNEKSPIAFSFMICLCCGMGVFLLFATHTYLIFTGQTTLEFHGKIRYYSLSLLFSTCIQPHLRNLICHALFLFFSKPT